MRLRIALLSAALAIVAAPAVSATKTVRVGQAGGWYCTSEDDFSRMVVKPIASQLDDLEASCAKLSPGASVKVENYSDDGEGVAVGDAVIGGKGVSVGLIMPQTSGFGTAEFASALRAAISRRGLTFPSENDCNNPKAPCKIDRLPETIEIWLYPDQSGKLEAVQININGTKGDTERAFRTGRMLCHAAVDLLSAKRVPSTQIDKAFGAAEMLSPWKGSIADANMTVRVDPVGDIGVCRIEPKTAGGASRS